MNESLTGLERHEGEKLMTSFLGERTLLRLGVDLLLFKKYIYYSVK